MGANVQGQEKETGLFMWLQHVIVSFSDPLAFNFAALYTTGTLLGLLIRVHGG